LLGPALGLAWGLERLWSVGEEKARLRLYASVSCGTALFLCALGSNVQTLCWQNSNALFQQALAVNPRSWGAANDFGAVLLEQGHPQLALNLLATAVRERPDFAEAHANLGVAHIRLSQFGPAEKEFREAVRCDPTLPAAWNGLGASLLNQGHANDAAAAFQHALSLQPGSPIAQNNLRLAQAQLTAR